MKNIRLTMWIFIGVVVTIACTSTIVMVRNSDKTTVNTKSDIDSVDIGKPIYIGGDQIKDTITNN